MLNIVKYDIRYLEALTIAFTEVFDELELPYFEAFEDSGHSFVSLDRTGKIDGFILISKTEEAIGPYEITFLGVLPRQRGKGYAQALIKSVLTVLKDPLWLNVMETNVQAVRVYEYLGFKVARRFKGESGDYGITYVINLKCHNCAVDLEADSVYMDEVPVGIVLTSYGVKQVEKLVRVCRKCMTRVEP
jgi:ribosomal protein S18 acetylase RimI-like enzyme